MCCRVAVLQCAHGATSHNGIIHAEARQTHRRTAGLLITAAVEIKASEKNAQQLKLISGARCPAAGTALPHTQRCRPLPSTAGTSSCHKELRSPCRAVCVSIHVSVPVIYLVDGTCPRDGDRRVSHCPWAAVCSLRSLPNPTTMGGKWGRGDLQEALRLKLR